jgi:hypothetical protein
MARKRWATFSVADHLNIRALVPDILLFDRLAFPFPADKEERDLWIRNDWDPDLLQYILVELEDLALAVDWGAEQRAQFQSNMKQAEALERLPMSWIEMSGPKKAEANWEVAKSMTRGMIGAFVKERRGTDFLVMPCYQSPNAFLHDNKMKIKAPDKSSRRESLAWFVGQEMRVPDDADPKKALSLAIDVARDPTYQRHRRVLYNWQEEVVRRDQTTEDDIQELNDLIATLNDDVAAAGSKTRHQWFFFVLKGIREMSDPLKALVNVAIDGCEILTHGTEAAPQGPIAAFQHVRRHVLQKV